jgi:hypothetical protein
MDGQALQVGADWVQVGEVVTAPEVLSDTALGRGPRPAAIQKSGSVCPSREGRSGQRRLVLALLAPIFSAAWHPTSLIGRLFPHP